MSIARSIVVNIKANVNNFEKGLKRAERAMKKFGGQEWGHIVKAFEVGSALLVGSLVMVTKHAFEVMDSTSKMSDALGIGTEALTALQYSASLAGVGTDQVNKSIQYMNKNLGQLAVIGGSQADLLKSFGLDAQELASMAPDRAFLKIADAVQKAQSPMERAAIATAAFGRSGVELIPMLMQGSQALADQRTEAEQLGIAFSRVDGAKVEAANDSLTKVGKVILGIGEKIAVTLAPMIEYVADGFIDWVKSQNQAGGAFEQLGSYVVAGMQTVVDLVNLGASAFYGMEGAIEGAYLASAKMYKMWLQAQYALTTDEGGDEFLRSHKQAFDDVDKAIGESQKALDEFTVSRNLAFAKVGDHAVIDAFNKFKVDFEKRAEEKALAVKVDPNAGTDWDALRKKYQDSMSKAQKGAVKNSLGENISAGEISLAHTYLAKAATATKTAPMQIASPAIDKLVNLQKQANEQLAGFMKGFGFSGMAGSLGAVFGD